MHQPGHRATEGPPRPLSFRAGVCARIPIWGIGATYPCDTMATAPGMRRKGSKTGVEAELKA